VDFISAEHNKIFVDPKALPRAQRGVECDKRATLKILQQPQQALICISTTAGGFCHTADSFFFHR